MIPSDRKDCASRGRRRLLVTAALLALVGLVWFDRDSGLVGRRFSSLAELELVQGRAGYVQIGSFGSDWPARVVETVVQRDAISFSRYDGTRHSYTGFDGFELQLIRLRGRDREVIVIFRSVPERSDDGRPTPAGAERENPVRIL